VNGFNDHLYTYNSELQLITVPLLISTIHKSPQHLLNLFQPAVFSSHSLATASNSGDSSASHTYALSSQPPMQNCLTLSLAYNISAQTTQKHLVYNSNSIVACISVAVGMCLLSCCSETVLVFRVTT
jgi:hypothetical protein